jgi:hypothetical protein
MLHCVAYAERDVGGDWLVTVAELRRTISSASEQAIADANHIRRLVELGLKEKPK